MRLEKKDVYLMVLSFCLLISGGMNILLSYRAYYPDIPSPEPEALVVGTGSGPHDLDPTDCWDSASRDVIGQVVETLFTYDTRQFVVDGTMPRINWLATNFSWDITNTILTVDIRTGVTFHDGTPMDATAVAWSFNRFRYLMNHTGAIPSDGRAVKIHSLYEFPDGSPVFQSVIALDVDTVVFTLTAPYAQILDAMCYISAGILSPSSTPATSIIDLATGDLVGTGPYTYDYYITDTEVRFTKFEDYWATQTPYNLEDEVMFDQMIYRVIDDPSALNYAMLAGDIDIIFGAMADLLPAYRASPWTTVYELETPGLTYKYLAFNNNQINVTWRKAMSYAINYSYIIEEMLDDHIFRSHGPISPGFGQYYDPMIVNSAPYYNLTIARETILNGLGGDARLTGLTANNNPNDTAWELANLTSFTYTYRSDNFFEIDLYHLLHDWFDDIGINLTGDVWNGPGCGIPIWVWVANFQIYFFKWDPDYLDPFNMLGPLFSNLSIFNTAHVNDDKLQEMIDNALKEFNDIIRAEIYSNISHYLAEELFPHAFFYHNKITTAVHSADLYDVAYNVLERWWALPVKRNVTWVPEI